MANTFITPRQVCEGMLAAAQQRVEEMPIEACRKVAEKEYTTFGMGIGAALAAGFVLACRERIGREGGAQTLIPTEVP